MILAYRINLPVLFGSEVLLCREEKKCAKLFGVFICFLVKWSIVD